MASCPISTITLHSREIILNNIRSRAEHGNETETNAEQDGAEGSELYEIA